MFFAATHPHIHRNLYASAGRSLERFLNDARMAAKAPSAHYAETENSYTLTLDMPGIAKEQLGISIEGTVLRLQSKEGAARSYRAAYEFAHDLDAPASQAKLENGVLTLTLAKKTPVNTATELPIQ